MPEQQPIPELERQYNAAFRRLYKEHDQSAREEIRRIRQEFSSRRGEVAEHVHQLPNAQELIEAKRQWVQAYSSGAGTPLPPVTRKPGLEQMLFTLVTVDEETDKENTTRRKNRIQTRYPIFDDRLEGLNAFANAMLADEKNAERNGPFISEIGRTLQEFDVVEEDKTQHKISNVKSALFSIRQKALPSLAFRVKYERENAEALNQGKPKRYDVMPLSEKEKDTWNRIEVWYFEKIHPNADRSITPLANIAGLFSMLMEDFYTENSAGISNAFRNHRQAQENARRLVMESGVTQPLSPLAQESTDLDSE